MDERSATNESSGGCDEAANSNATNDDLADTEGAGNDALDVNDELLGTLAEVEN